MKEIHWFKAIHGVVDQRLATQLELIVSVFPINAVAASYRTHIHPDHKQASHS